LLSFWRFVFVFVIVFVFELGTVKEYSSAGRPRRPTKVCCIEKSCHLFAGT
jgi:hypothetical protein